LKGQDQAYIDSVTTLVKSSFYYKASSLTDELCCHLFTCTTYNYIGRLLNPDLCLRVA